MDIAKLDADKFKNEFLMNLQDSTKQSEQSIEELSASIAKWKASLDIYSNKSRMQNWCLKNCDLIHLCN